MKHYNNIELVPEVDETNKKNVITVGNLHSKLWVEKNKEVIDTPEHYELASVQDGSEGLKIVDDGSLTDVDKEIQLSDVQSKLLDTDSHSYVSGEYVNSIPETSHTETYEETIYLPRSETPEGNILMTTDEFNNMWGTVEVLDYKQS